MSTSSLSLSSISPPLSHFIPRPRKEMELLNKLLDHSVSLEMKKASLVVFLTNAAFDSQVFLFEHLFCELPKTESWLGMMLLSLPSGELRQAFIQSIIQGTLFIHSEPATKQMLCNICWEVGASTGDALFLRSLLECKTFPLPESIGYYAVLANQRREFGRVKEIFLSDRRFVIALPPYFVDQILSSSVPLSDSEREILQKIKAFNDCFLEKKTQ